MRISFFTSIGYNVGDDFIREGLSSALDPWAGRYTPYFINKLDSTSLHRLQPGEFSSVSDKFNDVDVVIQAGAPVYWHLLDGASTSLTAEWFPWFWRDKVLAADPDSSPIFLNLGAGGCDAWGANGASFLNDDGCADFARNAGRRSSVTTVRDPVAARILEALGVKHHSLPCPAFLAGARHLHHAGESGVIGVNLMPAGGHFQLGQGVDSAAWDQKCLHLVSRLRARGRLLFIAHDSREADYMSRFAAGDEVVFFSPAWRDYFAAFAHCSLLVSSRVHGAVCAAGLGVPAMIIGSDTRALIGEYIGIPIASAALTTAEELFAIAETLWKRRRDERARLLDVQTRCLEDFRRILSPLIERAAEGQQIRGGSRRQPSAAVRLAATDELATPAFEGFMQSLNVFARTHSLRVFDQWSKIWEYPWLWRRGLGAIDWSGKAVVDLGSEISPLPWFVATLGAQVRLIETDPQWVPLWTELKANLKVNVEWSIVDSEELPVPDASVDVVTSFSVIEHQPDKARAVAEVIRVLKPDGLFAISFDICESDLGMTFPAWNGTALTLAEFERLIWLDPAFGNDRPPHWNREDIAGFLAWHKKTAAHHNYVVGAATLVKQSTESTIPLVYLSGWHSPETDSDGNSWRWCSGTGELVVRRNKPGHIRLNGQLHSLLAPDNVAVKLDGSEIARVSLPADQLVAFEVGIATTRRTHELSFQGAEPARQVSGDRRNLAFRVQNLRVTPTDSGSNGTAETNPNSLHVDVHR